MLSNNECSQVDRGSSHAACLHPLWSLQHGSCLLVKVNFAKLVPDRLLPACICGGGWHSPGSCCRPLVHESRNITACLLHSCAVSWGLTALPAHPDLGKTSMTFPHHAVPGALLCVSAQVLLSRSM
ncbi:hypothetical protein V5799_027944 [Amblyomma americanum]|uniref:Uncharacterized protein n=1 Tax=Amblyomma americanum TaxID=6943 RepID=A0AAQ4DE99_AMBAM